MKHALIIAENFLLSDSADKNCTLCLIEELRKLGYDIDVFSHTYENIKWCEEKNNIYTVHCFFEKEQYFIAKYLYKNRNFFEKIFYQILTYLVTKIGILNQKRKHYKKYLEINRKSPVDVIISVYCPNISNEMAHHIYRKSKKKSFLYFLDPHTYNYQYTNVPGKYDFETRARDEIKWAECARGIIYSKGILKENNRKNFTPYAGLPFIEVSLPNFEIKKMVFENKPQVKTVLQYTGKFYENIRNPELLIDILKELDSDKYVAEFYGECCDYLKDHYETLPKCVHLMGTVSSENCKKLLNSADILVNVGNTTPNQVPSKIFEYIATGKPILNIINSEDDMGLYYLSKYPKIYNIRFGESIDFDSLQNFLRDTVQISYETLHEIYKDFLAENVTKKIIDFIEKYN